MDISFPWPMSDGEWLAWSSAAVTILLGLLALFAPGVTLRLLRLAPAERHPEAIGEVRATVSGFYLGLGLACMLLAQPLLYMALGFSWAFTAFGRIVAMLSDRANTLYNWIILVVDLALAVLPLAFALGFVA